MDDIEFRRREEFRDQQAEIAGINNGRQARFLSADGTRLNSPESRERARQQAFQTQLELLLNDPAYRAHYDHVLDLIAQTQATLDTAIAETSETIERLEALINDLETRAAKLPDGTGVFLAADGPVYTADGRNLGSNTEMGIDFPKDAPSWEQYRGAREALKAARERMRDYGELQNDVLDPARERMNDPENPPTLEELGELERQIQERNAQLLSHSPVQSAFIKVSDPVPSDGGIDNDLIAAVDFGSKP